MTARRDLSDADAAELWKKLSQGRKDDIVDAALALKLASDATLKGGGRPDLVQDMTAAMMKLDATLAAALNWLRRLEPKG